MHPLVKRVNGLMRLGRPKPLWYDTIISNPPLSFKNHPSLSASKSAQIKPPKIVYPEDKLRARFYRDHPFELDTPIGLFNNISGNNEPSNSNSIDLESAVIGPEWAVQRQLQLMEAGMKEPQAYQKACEEFEQRKAEIEVSERLARQEQLQIQREKLRPLSQLLDSVFMEEKQEIEYNKANKTNTTNKYNNNQNNSKWKSNK